VLFTLNGEQQVGKGDRFIARAIRTAGLEAVVAVNKVDQLSRKRTLEALLAAEGLNIDGEIFPISARTGEGVPELVRYLVTMLPEGPFLYPAEDRSDAPERVHLAELIREQVLLRTRDELPHAVEVDLGELTEREDGLLEVEAALWVEGNSQKAILIGAGGTMIKAIGSAARKELQASLGRRVHLELRVRVRKAWRRDDALLDRLGIE